MNLPFAFPLPASAVRYLTSNVFTDLYPAGGQWGDECHQRQCTGTEAAELSTGGICLYQGEGRLFCTLKGYEACADEEDVLKEWHMTVMQTWIIRVVPSSVLMERAYYVPWNEVKQHMHMQSDWGRMQLKRESYQSYTAKPVDEKELEEIFIRTYGPIKRRPPQKAKPASNIIDLEKQNICYQPLPECLPGGRI